MIYVFGGSGFIGTRLCTRLFEKSIPFTIVDKKVSNKFPDQTVIADIRDRSALMQIESHQDSIIVNLAAEHRDDVTPKSLYDDVNVTGSKNICEFALKNKIKKIIFTSSVAVYGFAKPGTDETGAINYFNDYGRTKWLAENVYRAWRTPNDSLVIIRPTVVFGEQNRGNVYNLLRQMAGRFVMIGSGKNIKSMAYVENVAAFIEYSLNHFNNNEFVWNYIDKPDLEMNALVTTVFGYLGRKKKSFFRIPYFIGFLGGKCFDLLAFIIRKKLPISSIRVKKFCSTTMFESSIFSKTDFKPVVSLEEALKKTVQYEFGVLSNSDEVFYSE